MSRWSCLLLLLLLPAATAAAHSQLACAPWPGYRTASAPAALQAGGAEAAARSEAQGRISGSPRPGLVEHQLLRTGREGRPDISISYPSTGERSIDADIRSWAMGIADAFDDSLSGCGDANAPTPELWGSYSVTTPSPAALSLTFEIWTYTGGAHGNLDIITLNYSRLTGERLGLVDIFEDPDAALSIMSSVAYKELSRRLGGLRQEQMLRAGLAPVPENFASLTLTATGVRLNFQPYQVAPWAAGAQRVDIPLDALRPARPLLPLWEAPAVSTARGPQH